MWSYMYKEIEKFFLGSRQLCKPQEKVGGSYANPREGREFA